MMNRTASYVLQNVMPGLSTTDLLDEPSLDQRTQQTHRALSRHAQRGPNLVRGHAAVVTQQVQQLLLPRPQRELLRDVKERAEHIMLVDLERNDLGRVCLPSTVHVSESLTQETYSHVVHLVSDIRGTMVPNRTWRDLLGAAFPGGTITGCPKIKAMEIIQKLEPHRRGPYTGSLGWIGFTGDVTFNIMIRTLFLDKNRISFPVGAGIVADSDPKREYQETLHKAEALLEALGAASKKQAMTPGKRRKPL